MRTRLHWTRLALYAVGLLLGAGMAAEMIVRASEPENLEAAPPIQEQLEAQESIPHSPFVADAELGALLAPSRQNRVVTPEYSYALNTDHAGFPNPDPWPGALDIAVLGNSLLNGAGVGYEGQFSTLLQEKLAGRSVLNFSVHGGGTAHQQLTYEKFAAPLNPRLVIATLWLTWDINNSLHFHGWLADSSRPDFTEYRHTYGQTHRSQVPDEPSRMESLRAELRKFIGSSYLLRAAHRYSKSLRGIKDPIERVVLEGGEVLYLSTRDQKRLMSGWERAGAPELREIFFAPLEKLRTEVEAGGGRFLVVLVPSKEELYAAKLFPEILDTAREARMELEARRMPTLDLYPVFEAVAASHPVFYKTDMHLNAFGHQLVADALAGWIARERMFEPAD